MTETAKMTKIHVELDAEECGIGGESMWATPHGPGLYQLENIPFFAFDLNEGDIVRCDQEHQFIAVHKRSGLCTLRIIVPEHYSVEAGSDLIARIQEWGAAGCERGFGRMFAITVPAEAFSSVCEKLVELTAAGEIDDWEAGSVPE